jgi:excinuclease ABC subunit B
VLLGVTGSGKTFTMAQGDRAHAAARAHPRAQQDAGGAALWRVQELLSDNAVEYFVSYYDYYQPEAYVPRTDTYIEKDSSINEQIDRMRHSATRALLERDDVIIVASVSCIYGIGSVETYSAHDLRRQAAAKLDQRQLIADLVALQYRRVQADFTRGTFRVRGDTVDVFPAHYEDRAWRVSFCSATRSIRLYEFDPLTGKKTVDARIREGLRQFALCDAAPDAAAGVKGIKHEELRERLAELNRERPLLEAQRLEQRTRSISK